MLRHTLRIINAFATFTGHAQVESSQTGAWYMLFYKAKFKNSNWEIQGDFQYRDWRG
jgi:hypothetical protein